MTLVPSLLYQPVYPINPLQQKSKNHQIKIPLCSKQNLRFCRSSYLFKHGTTIRTNTFVLQFHDLRQVKIQNIKLLFIIRCVKSNIIGTPSHIFVMVICCGYLPLEFAGAICCRNLPQLFAVAFCRENLSQLFAVAFLPWEFAAAIYLRRWPQLFAFAFCRGNLPQLYCSFFFESKSFMIEKKPFLYVSKTFYL